MVWLAFGLVYMTGYLLAERFIFVDPTAFLWFRTVALTIPPVLGIGFIVRRRQQWAGCHWIFWLTVATGLFVSVIGFLGWTVDEILLVRQASSLEWHAVFALFGTVAPLLAQPHLGSRERVAATTSVDIAGIAVFAGFLFSYVTIGLAVAPGIRSSSLSLLLLSELLLILVLAGLMAASTATLGGPWGATYHRLALGTLIQLVARTLSNAEIWLGAYDSVALYDFAYIVPFFFYPWAIEAAPASTDQAESEADEAPGRLRPWLIFGALGLIPVLDYGLRAVFPIDVGLEEFREMSTSATWIAVLPLLMARLAVARTEFKMADEQVQLLAATIEQADDQIGVFTKHGRLQHVNSAYRRASGYTWHELQGMRPSDLLAEESRPQIAEIQASLGAGRPWKGTLLRRRRGGETFVSSSTIVPLADERNQQTHFASFERDVTEDTKLRDQLISSERRYRSLFDNAQLGIYRATPQGAFLAVNPTLVRMLAYDSVEELLAVPQRAPVSIAVRQRPAWHLSGDPAGRVPRRQSDPRADAGVRLGRGAASGSAGEAVSGAVTA